MQTASFAETIAAARLAVTSRATSTSTAPTAPAAPGSLTRWQARTRVENDARAAELPATALPRARAALSLPVSTPAPLAPTSRALNLTERPTEPPKPRMLALYPEEGTVRAARPLSRGELKLWLFLHRLAVDVGKERGYTHTPRQIALHCPAVTIAGALGITDRHLRRLAAGLERAGLLDCGGHAQQIGARSMYDGTLYAVLTLPGEEPPRLRAEDWRHNWRPDFEADVLGKTGAAAEMSGLSQAGAKPEDKYRAAKQRAAVPDAPSAPLWPSPDIFGPVNLRGVIEGIAALWRLHSSKRARAVGALASQIASALAESDRRRYWCGVIWQALTAQDEGRTGGLSALTAQFDRLAVDLREGAPWRSPGAVLAARWKGAM